MADKPNIILCMTDDQGWGDTGYNGHEVLQTPNLDQMAGEGIRFARFYAGAPVCSPTRGSCITGRHPYRYGVFTANCGRIKKEEVTLAEVLKSLGYNTGHFGKWHLGTFKDRAHDRYAPPWERFYDKSLATEKAVPSWNPYTSGQGRAVDPPCDPVDVYWEDGEPVCNRWPDNTVPDAFQGDDSRILMDHALPFIEDSVNQDTPFFATIWFHAPHRAVVAGPEHREIYKNNNEAEQHYYGCITAMDEQVGRLRRELKRLGISDNTMLWFCSDNGPEGSGPPDWEGAGGRDRGSAGPFRGRKRDLYEGGIRVPGLLVWPRKIKTNKTVDIPCSTLDYFPTILDFLGYQRQGCPDPIDGVSLRPLIEDGMPERPLPIAFESDDRSEKQVAVIDNKFKLITVDDAENYELYDLINDIEEKNNIASEHPGKMDELKQQLTEWRESCRRSLRGEDY